MIKLGKLIIEGYGSIPNYECDLDNGYINIIRGPNGYGKTTLLSSITWAFYGKPSKEGVTDVGTWKELRTKEYQGTKVEIYWNNNSEVHQVIRCSDYKGKVEGSKGGNRLVYLIEGVEVKNKKKLEIQALIEENLGLSYALFKNSIMFGQGLKRLIQETGPDKKKLFEEVFDVAYLSRAKAIAIDSRKEVKEEFESLSSELESLRVGYDTNRETFIEFRARESNREDSIKREIKEYSDELNILKNKISGYDSSVEKLLAKTLDKKAQLKSKMDKLKEGYSSNKEKLSEVTSVEGLGKLIKTIIKLILTNPKKAINKLKELENSINILNSYHENQSHISNKLYKLKDKEDELRQEIHNHEKNQEMARVLGKKIELIKSAKLEVFSPKYKEKYMGYKRKIKAIEKQILPLKAKLEDYDWVINDPLGNNGIRSYIFESSLGALNDTLMEYANILGLSIEFGVDLETTKKDFYTLVEYKKRIVDYNELSGGQKQLVNLAMAFAMWESTSSTKSINILFLDEVFESLSRDNIEIVLDLIKHISKGKSIYIITHHESLPLSNSKTINLAYKNGLTSFN